MKKIYFSLLIGLFLFLPGVVKAINHPFNQSHSNECLDDGKCMLLCGYETKEITAVDIYGKETYRINSIYLYYHFDGNYEVMWYRPYDVANMSPELTEFFATAQEHVGNVFFQPSIIDGFKEGVCPKYGYIDDSGFSDEICFDSDSKYCKETDPGGMGTDFNSIKGFESTLKYNYLDHVTNYFQNWSFNEVGGMTCDDILEVENAEEAVEKEVESYSNFLFGGDMPNFLKNNPTYKEQLEIAKSKYTERVSACKEEKIQEIENDESLSEEEKEALKDELEERVEDINDTIESTGDRIENIRTNAILGESINVTLNVKNGCDIFSGDMKNWLIQLLDIIKIVGVVLAAILSMVDFLKGVGTGSADTMKKVWKSVGNRLIAVILLFLLPVLIEFILGLITLNGETLTNPLCGIK